MWGSAAGYRQRQVHARLAAPHQRLSLTANAILQSRHIFLQIGGPAKKAVYDRALAGGPVEELPIRLALCQQDVPVEVWIAQS